MNPFDLPDQTAGVAPPWTGPWPPDPSWDETFAMPPVETSAVAPDGSMAPAVPNAASTPEPAMAPPAAGSPVANNPVVNQAQAAADSLFQAGPVTSPEVPPGAPVSKPAAEGQPWDADLIELEPSGTAPNWDELIDPYAPGVPAGQHAPTSSEPPDADLIEIETEPYAPTVAERGQRLAELLSPTELAMRQFELDQIAENDAVTKELKASAADRRRAEENERVYREAMERAEQRSQRVAAERERLANEKVDPDGWSDSRTLFQTISMYVAGIVGGLVQSRQGGPNQGLALINNAIERHIAAQRENLEHRRQMLDREQSSVDGELTRARDNYVTEEGFRQGARQRAMEQIKSEMQKFNPQGTQALKYARVLQDFQAQDAAAVEASRREALKEEREVGEFELKVRAQKEVERKNRAAEEMRSGGGRGGGGGGGGGVGSASLSKVKLTPEQLRALFPEGSWIPPEGAPPMSIEEYKKVAEAGRSGRSVNEPTEADKRDHELSISVLTKKLMGSDGKPYLAPDVETARLTRKKIAAALEVTDIINEILSIRDQVGGESGLINSKYRQRLDVLGKKGTMLVKAGTEGMSSDEDMKNIAIASGVADVASFRSKAASLKEARERIESELNTYLESHNYDGERIKIPNRYKGSPKETAEQKDVRNLIKSTTGEKKQSIPTAAIAFSPVIAGPARLIESFARSENTNLPDGDEKSRIDKWAAEIASGTPERRKTVMRLLAELGSKSRSPAVRRYARQELLEATQGANLTPDEKGKAVVSVLAGPDVYDNEDEAEE